MTEQQTRDSNIGGIIGLVFIGLIAWWVWGQLKPVQWTGVYESRTTNDIYALSFPSREDCSAWLVNKKNVPGAYTNYECGSDCKPPTTPLGLYQCKETFD